MNPSHQSLPTPGPRRVLRVLLCVAVSLATLIALFYTVENWRGHRAWQRYEREAAARGEALEFAPLVPRPVPDEQNLAMTPFLAPLLDFLPGTQNPRDPVAVTNRMACARDLPDPAKARDWRWGEPTDWPAYAEAFGEAARRTAGQPGASPTNRPATAASTNRIEAATTVLAALQACEAVLDELRAASRRAHCRFAVRYEEENPAAILLPHLAVLKGCARLATLRAGAELTLGQAGPALTDLDLAFGLADGLRAEPILISQLVRVAMVQMALQPVWEGLAEHRWSDAQLEHLQRRLARFDFLAGLDLALRGERAFGNRIIAYVRRHPRMLLSIGGGGVEDSVPTLAVCATGLIPRGWFYLEQVQYNQLFNAQIQPGTDLAVRRVDPGRIAAHQQALDLALRGEVASLTAHRLLSKVLLPAVPAAQRRFAHAQTMVDAALIACALERHRLAAGALPEALEALVPRYLARLPHDLVTGAPLKYRRFGADGYAVYSVGWNQQDDGGEVGSQGKTSLDLTEGDWVFRVP